MVELTELSDENFADFIEGNETVAVDFWAPWCAPCLKMGPIFEELAKEINGIAFAKLNVDDSPQISQQLGVSAIPTIIVFCGGRKVAEITGFRPKESLRAKLEELKG
jgi:thioredoxin 1